jgi:transcriptional regulator with XRE-family HTH domain
MHRGDKIKSLIRQTGISQKSVAETLGMEPTNLSRLLKDKDLKDGIVERICEVVGVDFEENFGAGAEPDEEYFTVAKYLKEKTEWLDKRQDYIEKIEEKNRKIEELTTELANYKAKFGAGGVSKVG